MQKTLDTILIVHALSTFCDIIDESNKLNKNFLQYP